MAKLIKQRTGRAISEQGCSRPPHFADLTYILTDNRFDRTRRLRRLQGWRGSDLDAARETGPIAHRVGPVSCAALAVAVIVTGSAPLLVATLATALIGALGPYHPFETVYNVVAGRVGLGPIPPNRAAKRFGCAVGSGFLSTAGVAMIADELLVANVVLGSLAALATFVAITDICVPSVIFTLLWGSERATTRTLLTSAE